MCTKTMNEYLLNIYKKRCSTKSDINEHLPILKKYAEKCDHITEFGVWKANSTIGLLAGIPKTMRSYDIRIFEDTTIQLLYKVAQENSIDYEFIQKSSIEMEIDQTDLLFIDSLHLYSHLKEELNKHGLKVNQFIILHDTAICRESGMSMSGRRFPGEGLLKAINEFLDKNKNWSVIEDLQNNSGLMVLKNNKEV